MPHAIRTSASRSFRGCRRRWNWAYREGYAPLEEPRPLEFGRAFHAAMEEIYNVERWANTTPQQKLEFAIKRFVDECEIQRKAYLAEFSIPRLDREQKDDYDSRIELGTNMLTYYVLTVHPEKDTWFKPVKIELEFEIPLYDENGVELRCYNPQCGQDHEAGDIVVYQGRVDALVEDIVHGGYYIVDWKTAAELRAREDLLWMDDQICRYCMALRLVLNIDIRGFLYVEIRKDYPKPPKLLKRKYAGKWYSTNAEAPTTLELFRETVKGGDAEAFNDGLYDDYLVHLGSSEAPKFYQRFRIEKSEAELKETYRTASLEAEDMVDANLRIYPSTGRFSCPSCAFKSPCAMQMKGADYVYTLDSMFRKVEA